eukprot:6489391-Amphidinium_carterae.1
MAKEATSKQSSSISCLSPEGPGADKGANRGKGSTGRPNNFLEASFTSLSARSDCPFPHPPFPASVSSSPATM